jgi:hypothetical protein
VEQTVRTTVMLEGTPLRLSGRLDLVDDAGTIRDAKFATDALTPSSIGMSWQSVLYPLFGRQLFGAEWRGGVAYDVVSLGRKKIAEPSAKSVPGPVVTDEAIVSRLRDAAAVDAAINSGLFPRNPGPNQCGKCAYKRTCWGGVLPPESEAAQSSVYGVVE